MCFVYVHRFTCIFCVRMGTFLRKETDVYVYMFSKQKKCYELQHHRFIFSKTVRYTNKSLCFFRFVHFISIANDTQSWDWRLTQSIAQSIIFGWNGNVNTMIFLYNLEYTRWLYYWYYNDSIVSNDYHFGLIVSRQ